MRMKTIPTILLLLAVNIGARAVEPTSLKALLAGKGIKQDTTISISATTKQKRKDKEVEATEKMEVFITADRLDRVLLKDTQISLLSDGDLCVAWSGDSNGFYSVELFANAAAQWSNFVKRANKAFWVIPVPGNVAYFDDNFTIVSVDEHADGTVVATFRLRETPSDISLRPNKEERVLNIKGALTIRADTGLVSDATVEASVTGLGDFPSITVTIAASPSFKPIPAATFEIPPRVAKKVAARKARGTPPPFKVVSDYGSATARVNFDGMEHSFTHPVANIGVWQHKPGIRTVRIDIFQKEPREEHIEQIWIRGAPIFIGKNDFVDGKRQVPHLVLNLHVKDENLTLRKDAIEFVGVSIMGISDSWLNLNVSGPSATAPLIENLSGKLALGETITGKIKGSFDQAGKKCAYDIEFSAKVFADIPSEE